MTTERGADLVLHGGVVHAMDPLRIRAQAVAIGDGRILAVGSDAEIAAWAGPDTEVVDLAGAMVLPGFHDSHLHLIAGGLQELSCALFDARTPDQIVARVQQCAKAEAPGDRWLVGAGWDLSLFPAANPNRSLLDRVVPDRPVFLEGADGHSAWVNTKALALAGIDRATPDPPGGVIERDGSGEPSGTLRESAVELVAEYLPEPTTEKLRAALRHGLQRAASFGITSVIDPSVTRGEFRLYDQADRAGELSARVLACVQPVGRRHAADLGGPADPPPAVRTDSRAAGRAAGAHTTLGQRGIDAVAQLGARARAGSQRLRTGCIKVFVDGVLEGETAALLEPYLGRGDHRGMLDVVPAALAAALTQWDRAGIQVHLHTVGDRAVRTALDAIEAARRANGRRDTRHHLAHLQLVDPADIARFAALDVTATFQALWAYPDTYIEDINLGQVGAERVSRMYPIGSIHRASGRIAGGSDWPVSSMNPLLAIEVALTRQDPAGGDADTLNAAERVDLDTMLAAYTVQGAWLMRDEARTGTIEVGKAADLVVLERDLFAIEPGAIGEVRVLRTMIAGETVYRAAE